MKPILCDAGASGYIRRQLAPARNMDQSLPLAATDSRASPRGTLCSRLVLKKAAKTLSIRGLGVRPLCGLAGAKKSVCSRESEVAMVLCHVLQTRCADVRRVSSVITFPDHCACRCDCDDYRR